MKKILFFAVLFCFCVTSVHAEITEGWRMGVLQDVQSKGLISKELEGTLSMGVDGSPLVVGETVREPNGSTKVFENVINPWKFMAGTDSGLERFKGQMVVIKYIRDSKTMSFSPEAFYRLVSISGLDTSPMPAASTTAKVAWKDSGNQSTSSGRFVQATSHRSGGATNYEIIFQTGDSGGKYRSMTCLNKSIYEFALDALMRGQKVTIYYEKLGIMGLGSFSNAGLRIVRIDIAK